MSECIKCASTGITISERYCYDCDEVWCPQCGDNLDGIECPACGSHNTGQDV